MTQVNVDPDDGGPRRSSDAATEATKNLTWAIAAVIVIAAVVIAVVYLAHSLHP